MGTQARERAIAPSPPRGAERVGVRWGIPERLAIPTSPSDAFGAGPSLSPLKGGEGGYWIANPVFSVSRTTPRATSRKRLRSASCVGAGAMPATTRSWL